MDTNKFQLDGFSLLDDAVPDRLLKPARDATDQLKETFRKGGIRNALTAVPGARQIVNSLIVRDIAQSILSPDAFITRAILFDKSPNANWDLSWHQDTAIAVGHRCETPGFGPWSVKQGVHHVRPTPDVLEAMLTIRIHLDDCPSSNGPLRVLPSTHAHGFLTREQISHFASTINAIECAGEAGSIVAMRPLVLHASHRASQPARRRILHLEFALHDLPGDLSWLRL